MKVDASRFNRAMDEMLKFSNDAKKVIRQQAALLVKDLIHLTPPFSDKPSSESYNVQRRVGEKAVERDIRNGWIAIDSLEVFSSQTKTGKRIRRLFKNGSWKELQELLNQIGFKRLMRVESELTKQWQDSARDKRGHVAKGAHGRGAVGKQRELDRFVKLRQLRVGAGKAGWKPSASMVGHSIPAWIGRHSSMGTASVKEGRDSIEFTFRNFVPHIQLAGRELKVVQTALDNRATVMVMAMKKRLAAREAAAKRRASV